MSEKAPGVLENDFWKAVGVYVGDADNAPIWIEGGGLEEGFQGDGCDPAEVLHDEPAVIVLLDEVGVA
ncbi:MAG TPA: hypothetical protein VJW76_01085, partial [Verrucomicrobiae bacterium]|nr:hypothetical protein [Verrucomicrobiae bacterium]